MEIFSVYDSKAKAYQRPMLFDNGAQATRSFEVVVNDPNSDYSRWPEDFVLFKIGEFDELSGSLTSCVPLSYGTALSFKKENINKNSAV